MLETSLQTTLAERCKLCTRRVREEVSGYALVVKDGTKLKRSTPDVPIPSNGMQLPDGRRAIGSNEGNLLEWHLLRVSSQNPQVIEIIGGLFRIESTTSSMHSVTSRSSLKLHDTHTRCHITKCIHFSIIRSLMGLGIASVWFSHGSVCGK